MARLEFDHIAVAAETLRDGQQAVEDALGVRLQPGGVHAHFGTHNMLLGLEDGLYLEVIAINPDAETAARPRWFDLDRFSGWPRMQNWICRSDDLEGFVGDHPQVGQPVSLTRGDLRWRMAVPETGALPFDNLHPAVMQWDCKAHPAAMLTPSGCRLQRLVVRHPQAEALSLSLSAALEDARVVFEIGAPGLRAEIETPFGLRVLK